MASYSDRKTRFPQGFGGTPVPAVAQRLKELNLPEHLGEAYIRPFVEAYKAASEYLSTPSTYDPTPLSMRNLERRKTAGVAAPEYDPTPTEPLGKIPWAGHGIPMLSKPIRGPVVSEFLKRLGDRRLRMGEMLDEETGEITFPGKARDESGDSEEKEAFSERLKQQSEAAKLIEPQSLTPEEEAYMDEMQGKPEDLVEDRLNLQVEEQKKGQSWLQKILPGLLELGAGTVAGALGGREFRHGYAGASARARAQMQKEQMLKQNMAFRREKLEQQKEYQDQMLRLQQDTLNFKRLVENARKKPSVQDEIAMRGEMRDIINERRKMISDDKTVKAIQDMEIQWTKLQGVIQPFVEKLRSGQPLDPRDPQIGIIQNSMVKLYERMQDPAVVRAADIELVELAQSWLDQWEKTWQSVLGSPAILGVNVTHAMYGAAERMITAMREVKVGIFEGMQRGFDQVVLPDKYQQEIEAATEALFDEHLQPLHMDLQFGLSDEEEAEYQHLKELENAPD